MSNEVKILFMEDEETILEVTSEYLKIAGYNVTQVRDGEEALKFLKNDNFDLCIFDIMVPKISGIELLNEMQNINIETPVIMLTALGDEKTQVEAFNKKADDYIIKPVSPLILLKRVETILRRTNYLKNKMLSIDETAKAKNNNLGLEVNKESYEASYNGVNLNLTVSEFLLLETLFENKNIVFTRERLINSIFNDEYICSDRIIDTHVKNLRKKLPKNYIKTVIGLGYKFEEVD